ncbi:O-antigen ligase family protein [Novipirellula artificiosorum]|uniref:O-Antigen ligase n=1 Tax=Novipirellula artificiosorum TaxID=2528016 RepID=A0A5C6DE59_9BACT|nr:O-antigen ligase family protein [Novipirellula artificiosorum]TWU34938.1 O-Antigen ligase [Novipirellula artificiosorum]
MLSCSRSSTVGLDVPRCPAAAELSWLERVAVLAIAVEIPLGIDKYYAYHEQDAEFGAVAGLGISLTSFALIFLYVRWFADASLHRRRMFFRPLFGVPMLIYLVVTLLSALSAVKPILSLFDFALLFHAYALFIFLANRIQTRQDIVFCIVALATAIVVQVLLMFYAVALGLDGDRTYLGPLLIQVWEGKRYAGSMHAPNLAGSTLAAIWLPVSASLLFLRNRRVWWFVLAATMMGLVGILMTQSRGAVLTTFIGVVVITAGLMSRRWVPRWAPVLAVLCCFVSLYPLFHFYQNRLSVDDGGSAASRKHLSLIALEAISQRPIMGYGAGNCHLACRDFADQAEYRAEWYYTTHCKYLLVWVETGIVGLLAFLMILATGFWQGVNVWRSRDPIFSVLGLAVIASIVGGMLHMAVDLFNSRAQVQILWFLLGLNAATFKILYPNRFAQLSRSAPFSATRLATRLESCSVPSTGSS